MEFLEASDPEWSEMWAELALYDVNDGDPVCAHMNVSWEYMGSTPNHHHLRHRKHPKTGKKEYIYIERRAYSVRWA